MGAMLFLDSGKSIAGMARSYRGIGDPEGSLLLEIRRLRQLDRYAIRIARACSAQARAQCGRGLHDEVVDRVLFDGAAHGVATGPDGPDADVFAAV